MSNHIGSYGGLAGFAGPALGDGGPVEVVRFQDLHRQHAPASAGLPEMTSFGNGAVGMDAPMHFGDALPELPVSLSPPASSPSSPATIAPSPVYGAAADVVVGGVKSFAESFEEQLSAPQREREREYQLEMAKLGGAPAKKEEEEDNTLKYALWAAGGLLGIGAIVLIVKAVSSDDTPKKKES